MKIIIEYKGTAKSKFTFTPEEVRIKIKDGDNHLEDFLIEKATRYYNALVASGWSGITLRCFVKQATLRDSYKNPLAIIEGNTVKWVSTCTKN